MSYRRRKGRRWNARRKVTRADMVKFYQIAGKKEREAAARQQAEALARWMKRGFWAAGAAAAAVVAWVKARGG